MTVSPHDSRHDSAPAVRVLGSEEIPGRLDDIAVLRVRVFREFPYRYEGSADYEREYLSRYAASERSVVVVAESGGATVGASTGLPLADAEPAFRAPFERQGMDPARVFYFGESVLLPTWRGHGIGHRFFDERERHAARLGFSVTAFCAVDRDPGDPHRPKDYRPLDAFWRRRGYVRRPDLGASFDWREIGAEHETSHTLTFWIRFPV